MVFARGAKPSIALNANALRVGVFYIEELDIIDLMVIAEQTFPLDPESILCEA